MRRPPYFSGGTPVELVGKVKKLREDLDYVEKDKEIDLYTFFKTYPVEPSCNSNFSDKPCIENPSPLLFAAFVAASPWDLPLFSIAPVQQFKYIPFIAVITSIISGLRLVVESEGISPYAEGHPRILGSGNHYVLYGTQKLTIKQYIKAISQTLPRFKEDFNQNPTAFEFQVLKIGLKWDSRAKRILYVDYYNKKGGYFHILIK